MTASENTRPEDLIHAAEIGNRLVCGFIRGQLPKRSQIENTYCPRCQRC
jgi:hypothetical protein